MEQKSIGDEIALAAKQGANMLMPTTEIRGLSQLHVPVVDSVYLSANPQGGDVYPEKTSSDTKFRIAAQGLRKLAVAAGITWHPYECKRTDNRQDRDYVSYQAVGSIKKNDGTSVAWKGEFDLDLHVVEQELRELYHNKSKNWNKTDREKETYIETSMKRDLLQKRKHKVKLCETGAMNRVIRAILGLHSSYSKAELSKPFVVLRIVFQPDFSDPETKRQITAAAIASMTGVYGAPAPQPIDVPPDDYQTIDVDGTPLGDVEPNKAEPLPDEKSQQKEQPEEPITEKNKPETKTMLKKIFSSLSEQGQVEELIGMAKLKGYDIYSLPTRISMMDDRNRERFFGHLYDMEDAEPITSDDIPF